MRPLRYSINVTLDGCCDHRVISGDFEELHDYAAANLKRADALIFGRVTYEMMESAFRQPASADGAPVTSDPFALIIDPAKKYVVSNTLKQVDWNAELVNGDLGEFVQQLKREPGNGLTVGGVQLPLALAELGLIDEYEFIVHPPDRRPRADTICGLVKVCRPKACQRGPFRLRPSSHAIRT